ncbi:MAG: cytochrome c biogenesis protein CcsA [Lewinellaceae bacterium]|nr:cytochrome c biogenesis protein CcsA [Lewinellaceae bacterium]
MQKWLTSIIFSNRLMALLFVVFAVAMAAGTFIENEYNTDAARQWVYNAWWFEAILCLFAVNFMGNIKKYRLLRKEKWPVLTLHLSFIFIISGAFITRYFGYEGIMSVREGQVTDQMISDKAYLTVFIDSKNTGRRMRIERPLLLSPVFHNKNHFVIRSGFEGVPVEVAYKNFVANTSSESGERPPDDILVLSVKAKETENVVLLSGKKGKVGQPRSIVIDNFKYTLFYGSKSYTLPFKIKLRDFIAEKYPGASNSYASFESKVTVMEEAGHSFDARIYMNHVLDHKGYRFFQASFHPDEKGAILTINHDFWGTWVTYTGYFILYAGLAWMLLDKHSRFGQLRRKLRNLATARATAGIFLFLLPCLSVFGQEKVVVSLKARNKLEAIISARKADEALAARFGALVIQDNGGRMKPVNTYASELLRKVSKSDKYNEMGPNQVILSMLQFPKIWYNVPIIYLKRESHKIRPILNLAPGEKYAPLSSFFDSEGNYILSEQAQEAYRAAIPDQSQKNLIHVDRRVNLLYNALSGKVLKIFPIPGDPDNRWASPLDIGHAGITGKDSLFIRNIMPLFYETITQALKTGDYSEPGEILSKIERYQVKYGSAVRPGKNRIKAEIVYNSYDVFKNLFAWYLYAGALMLLFSILYIFKPARRLHQAIKLSYALIAFLFVLQTAGLLARWYISGHAPWSDAYETMIYISWATMLFGLILGRTSGLAVASSAFVASMMLMVAHWNWLDPAIANLQPVLNSYWLMIHVAIIVASYGPFTLGMILGVTSLILMLLLNSRNRKRLNLQLAKLLLITEMSLTIGLVMLVIGNFLGGQWANESWGRYWGWDPKETWALISIMVYAFILHMRLVPGLRGRWLFAFMSVIGFYSILMTYFGVNFYLSGLHSYAQGEQVVTPGFVYYSLGLITILAAVAYYKQRKFSLA